MTKYRKYLEPIGMPADSSRNSRKTTPIVQPKRIETILYISDKDFTKLIRGFSPSEMEEKWFYYYENDWLYFHRSWTCNGIYQAKLIRESEGFSIREFWVERDNSKYRNLDDEEDLKMFKELIDWGIKNSGDHWD
jgi:hypothetical protein